MKDIIKEFADSVKDDGRRAIRRVMRDVANKVERDFKAQGRACIDNYYEEYEPRIYERTFNLMNNVLQPYRRYRKNEIDVGVSFEASEMNSYVDVMFNGQKVKRKDYDGYHFEDTVVQNFMEGIHGRPSVYVGAHVDETMQLFTNAYVNWELDKYFADRFEKYNG